MTRAITALTVLLVVVGAYMYGGAAERTRDAENRADTLERIHDADIGDGNAGDDRDWLDGFLGGVPEGGRSSGP